MRTYKDRNGSILLSVFLLMAGLSPVAVVSKTNDGQTPSTEQVCSDAGLSGALRGLCIAYGEANDCDTVDSPANANACTRLEDSFRKLSGGRELSSVFAGGISGTVPPEGGTIELSNIVAVDFPADAFLAPANVNIVTTSDETVAQQFEEFTFIFRPGPRLAYEIRINTGISPPLSEYVVARVTVPDDLIAAMPPGNQIEVFAQIPSGGREEYHDLFDLIPSIYDSTSKVVTVELPGAAFTNMRRIDGTYEAILTLAWTPGINQPQSSLSEDKRRLNELSNGAEERGIIASIGIFILDLIIPPANAACDAAAIGCPVSGGCAVNDPFSDERRNPVTGVVQRHPGVDYAATDGTEILSAASGVVERAYSSTTYGNTIIVRHDDGSATLYAHLKTMAVMQGRVEKGQVIGTADSTGQSTGSHLHFEYVPNGEIILSKNRIDPDQCVNAEGTAQGSITLSDNGPAADDAFSATLDGVFIGSTTLGASNTLAISNLIPGQHTLTVTFTDQIGGAGGVGTLGITLNDGLTFSMGGTQQSATLQTLGDSVSYNIIVPIITVPLP